jgi:GH15 family glucan-1,4-alpha-glucosidase
LFVESDGADGALFVTAMVDCGVLVFAATEVSLPFRFADEFFRFAEREAGIFGEAFRAFGDQHHVRALLEDFSREADGIFQAM